MYSELVLEEGNAGLKFNSFQFEIEEQVGAHLFLYYKRLPSKKEIDKAEFFARQRWTHLVANGSFVEVLLKRVQELEKKVEKFEKFLERVAEKV